MIRETFKDISLPPFVHSRHSLQRDNGRQIDWSLVTNRFMKGAFVVTMNAAALAAATSITVLPLPKALKAGQVIDFGGAKFARVTADTAAGEVTVPVAALGVALGGTETSWLGGRGGKFIPAGTEMDLLSSGKIVPSILATGGVTCYCLLATDASEDMPSDGMGAYGVFVGGNFFENLLPAAIKASSTTIDSNFKTELRARGGSWQFFQYSDNT
ncbi:MAG: hypothetical protein KG003_08130 [Bacteroidetes bacterium]|nr:hypothetical protein [Bacteroidota bacterium]